MGVEGSEGNESGMGVEWKWNGSGMEWWEGSEGKWREVKGSEVKWNGSGGKWNIYLYKEWSEEIYISIMSVGNIYNKNNNLLLDIDEKKH